ncbi:polysaccharide deacetylase family protein [Ramlibacter sp. WS9]|uniref:polysaccharide deacetylase family protein n=1 Tax=Ramlibacter sp. WS9 TaxID=1882741 RepID=UPI0011435B85|nr:polysaccharide deacetylase family protein [Ramlibacter sp. WS9]
MLSFDCEGKWGLTDCLTERHQQLYTTSNLEAIYWRLTSLLRKYGIDATFAFTAAFSLTAERFDRLRPEMEELRTRAQPWIGRALAAIEKDKGQGWFGPYCFDMVREPGCHEIASHGFSHLPWRASYATRAALDAELAMCRRVPAFSDGSVSTFVFPRNQVAHQDLLAEHGFTAYREKRTFSSRAANLASEFNLLSPSEDFNWNENWNDKIPIALPAGRFLNWRHGLRRSVPAAVTVRRWQNMLRDAASGGGIVHAWTHPENFVDGHDMFQMLEEILRFVADEREAGRLHVLTNTQFVARTERLPSLQPVSFSPSPDPCVAHASHTEAPAPVTSAPATRAPVSAVAQSAHWEVSEVALSQTIFAAMQVYIPWLAASKAPLADLATLALAQSIVWPLAMIAQLQLRTIYVVQGERSLLPLFVQLRLAGCVFLVACAAIATGMLHSGPLLLSLAVALALIKCVENVADIMHGELQRAMEVSRGARSQTYRCAIFISVYTVGMVSGGQLLLSLVAAAAAMAAWVVVVDMRPRRFWRDLLTQGGNLDQVGPTLKAGLSLSTALAFSSLSVMVGRWAAVRAGDTEVLAATALAGTMASIVAVVLVATQQYSFTPARAQLDAGGMPAFRAWCRAVTWRLHVAFAGLTLAWVAAAVLVYYFGLPVPGHHLGIGLQHTVVVLAGCFLAGGWLSVLCFADILLQYLMRRHGTILFIAMMQVAAAAAASMLLYPLMGWIAIGIAELVRGLTFIVAVRYTSRLLEADGGAST